MDGYWLSVSAAVLVGVCALFLLVALVLLSRRRMAKLPPSPAAAEAGPAGPAGPAGIAGIAGTDEPAGTTAIAASTGTREVPATAGPADLPYRAEWLPAVTSCVLSLSRARRAVDAVSSQEARGYLHVVLRRMDAELPNVRVLAELGMSLQQTGPRDDAALQRVRAQLQDAVRQYASFAERLLGVVEDLVNEPDLDRTRQHVDSLRRQFPLLRPMSELVDGARPPVFAPG